MYINHKSNYDKYPTIRVEGFDHACWQGYTRIVGEIKKAAQAVMSKSNKATVVVETYPGVRKEEIYAFKALDPALVIDADDITASPAEISAAIDKLMTHDRVFGIMTHFKIDDFIDPVKLEKTRGEINRIASGIVLVYGMGAGKIVRGDIRILADLARWEIQSRFRSGEMGNWKADNPTEDALRKYKRGFFFEWRVADRIKKDMFTDIHYLLDTNKKDDPKMITGEAFLRGLNEAVNRPFRLVPYFDPGVWGGQWMKEVCGLDPKADNYAWSFDGVPEENSLYLQYGDTTVEIPSLNVVFHEPVKLLGNKVHSRFGTQFPIRFDFLDTMEGGHLSLQVHPLVEYIQDTFGMPFTQDESYYMLDATDDARVYLGLKEGIDGEAMIKDLERAQETGQPFPDEKYIHQVPAKKHGHYSIPAGTIHCISKGGMVLEISATPYIFTFKLWDWGRLGLDGKPRPVHIEHGKNVIQWDRTSSWVEKNLVDLVKPIASGDGWREESTGLHERQFIETRRHWFTKKVRHTTHGSVNVLNLVQGEEAVVESPTNAFKPFVVHYAETFIVPEHVKEYTIAPHGPSIGKELATIKAFVRCHNEV